MQPISGYNYVRVSGTAAGTTVCLARPGQWGRIVMGQNKIGTVSFYDTNVASGTTSGNFLGDFQNTCGTTPTNLVLQLNVRYGLTAVTGGTTDMLVGVL